MAERDFDYILVGGGLQSGLIVAALMARRPEARIALVEREARLGGNHTWCFHSKDVSPEARGWIDPLVERSWSGYSVAFPNLRRRIDGEYSVITSQRFHDVISSLFAASESSRLLLDTSVASVGKDRVELAGGGSLRAPAVVDARGPASPAEAPPCGFQKFLGLEVQLRYPHALDVPILMDAMVDQKDGYRFFYTLPLSNTRLLVEDTYFNESPALDQERVRRGIFRYADRRGWKVSDVVREETGVLPMPWDGGPVVPNGSPLAAGYGGGWYHPATGYSFPVAARLAEFVASLAPEELFGQPLKRLARAHSRQVKYCFRLNRLLFRWLPPQARWRLFERFYRMPDSAIERFYALRLRRTDRLRIVTGWPVQGWSVRYRFRAGAPR